MGAVSIYEDILERHCDWPRFKIIPSRLLRWGPSNFRPNSRTFNVVYCRICKESFPFSKWNKHDRWHKRDARANKKKSGNRFRWSQHQITRAERIARKNRLYEQRRAARLRGPVLGIAAEQLAKEIGVATTLVINEAGRRGEKIQQQSDLISLRVAAYIRDYIRLVRRHRARSEAKRPTSLTV